jgi:aldehyde dehydrogenase (NAD+)
MIVKNLIGGEWVGAPETDRRNPARAADVVAEVARATTGDVVAAIDAAAVAAREWRDTPPAVRGAVLLRAAELLSDHKQVIGRDLCREEGKTLAEATGEVVRAADILRFFAGAGWRLGGETLPATGSGTHLYTVREPLGVVAVITPWNFPLAIPAWKIAPALVAGNAVVLKPAGLTPLTAHHLADCLVTAGVPDGVLNVVHGSGAVVGDALVNDARVAAISFTGSSAVGTSISAAAASRLARVQLEMGGKNALVVLDDADPARAAAIAARGGFGLTGQACTATSRVLVTENRHEEFVRALAAEAERYRPGDGQDEGVLMGPVVSKGQLESDLEHIEGARQEGGRLVGEDSHRDLFLSPLVVDEVRPGMRIASEEVFGPVVAVLPVKDLADAIAVANESPYGLTAGIVTNDLSAALRFAREAEVGVVKVNQPTTGLELNAPFGGMKLSSTGTFREQGATATEFYTRVKTVYVDAG